VRPEELLVIVESFVQQQNHEFGFEYIKIGDGQLLPVYPCALVVPAGVERRLHGTHYFLTTLNVDLLVMHGNLEQNRMDRTIADLELATKVVTMLHDKGLTFLDSRIHKAYVATEEPATISTENITAIGTSLTIAAEVREAFK
jgi:hypothetical protein